MVTWPTSLVSPLRLRHRFSLVCLVMVTASVLAATGAASAPAATGGLNQAPDSPHPAGTNPYSSAIGDLNGDGDPDLAVGNFGSGDVSVLLGDGNGGFAPVAGSPFAAAAGAGAAAIGDVDGDGDADLAVSANQANEIVILLGDGNGGFTPGPGPFPVGAGPYPAALGDLDGDGDLDLAVHDNGSSDVSILLNDGKGGFEPSSGGTLPTGAGPDSVAIADLDGDGDPDLAVGDVNGGDITILLGDGSGGFSPAPESPLATGIGGGAVSISDLDGDGDPDLAGLAFEQSTNARGLLALLNDGNGGFAAPEITWISEEFPVRVAFGDLDGDGFPDAVTANGAAGRVSVLLGDGAGGFEVGLSGSVFEAGLYPITTTIGDLNSDSKPDVVASNFASNDVSVLLNDYGPPALLPHVVTGTATGVTRTEATLQGSVDPAGNGTVTDCRFEWGATTSYGESASCSPSTPFSSPTAVSAQLSGLSTGTTYHFRVVATNANGVRHGHDRSLTTTGAVAGLVTEPATNVGSTGATLNGAFEGEGTETVYHFEYGTTPFYGSSTPQLSAGSPIGPTATPAEIDGLESSTTYHFRLVAENAYGRSMGADRTFTTTGRAQLEATTEPVLSPGRTEAFVGGRAYPSVVGDVKECSFEYGTTLSYGQEVACEPPVPYSSPTFVVGLLTGLSAGTEYHFRVAISNGVEIAHGEDMTLTTKGPGPDVQTFEVTEITEIGATFNGALEGQGEDTFYYFEYGTDTSYGSYTAPPPGTDLGSLVGFQFVSNGIGQGLRPNTTYHVRIVAADAQGTSYGNDVEFTTPGVDLDGETGVPSNVTETTATVSGDVDPLGGGPITECHFDYGTTIAMEQTAPCVPAPPYSSPTSVSASLSGLQPGTFYFYRLAASNGHSSIVRGRRGFQTVPSSADNSASETVAAGGTVSTNEVPTPEDPVGTSVTSPQPGSVSIAEGPVGGSPPSGYQFFGEQIQIEAPPASAADPLVLTLAVDVSLLPAGVDASNIQVFRDGVAIADCAAGAGTSAAPDPCIAARTPLPGGDVGITVRTSHASAWNIGLKIVPDTTVDGPSGLTTDPHPIFIFTSGEAGSTFQCRFDSEKFRRCRGAPGSDRPAGKLADGPHSFEVRAIDADGDPDPTPAHVDFTVDTKPPATKILSAPKGPTSGGSATIAFASNDPDATFECQLDGGAFAACSSPRSYDGLARGGHVFRVRAVDPAGNVEPSPAVASFTMK
jgi:hypothetical protein